MKKKILLCFMVTSLIVSGGMFGPEGGYGGMTTQQKIILQIFDKAVLPGMIAVGLIQAGAGALNIPEEKKHELLTRTIKDYYAKYSKPNMKYQLDKEKFKLLPADVYKHTDCIIGVVNYNGRIIIFEENECVHKKYRGVLF